MEEVLGNLPRSGARPTFTAEDVTQISSIASLVKFIRKAGFRYLEIESGLDCFLVRFSFLMKSVQGNFIKLL